MSGKRSRFLVHWTGPDLEREPSKLTDKSRALYVERLASILERGLRLCSIRESVGYIHDSTGSHHGHSWRPRLTCFTEVRLSQASFHAREYGLLGIGFAREWVVERGGGPVHYVRGRDRDVISENLGTLSAWLSALAKPHYTTDRERYDEIMALWYRVVENLCFTKRMSRSSRVDDFERLDEHEWRIVRLHRPFASSTLFGEDGEHGTVLIAPDDVRLLVFPDFATRSLALADGRIKAILARRADGPPIMLTLDDAEHL
jgi:hypothetical protein